MKLVLYYKYNTNFKIYMHEKLSLCENTCMKYQNAIHRLQDNDTNYLVSDSLHYEYQSNKIHSRECPWVVTQNTLITNHLKKVPFQNGRTGN